jgi:multidrug resistance efflux pump
MELIEQGRRTVRRIFLIYGLSLLILLIIGGIGFYVWHQSYYFYTTDDAFVSGNIVSAVSPQRGVIRTIYHHLGGYVHKGDIIAIIDGVPGPDSGGTVNVLSPVEGTIISEGSRLNNYQLATGQQVELDQPIAQVVRLSQLWVTAYVAEDHIKDVHVGQGADVTLSGSSDTFHGTVNRILNAAANDLNSAQGQQVPTSDYASGNYVPVAQRIPVQISLDGIRGYPGTTASVTIHLHD